MAFSHEKLRVYQKSLHNVAWADEILSKTPPSGAVKNQLERAATSIPLNIAEGNGKISLKDRSRFLQIAHGSAVECAVCLDVLSIKRLDFEAEARNGEAQLELIVNMLYGMLSKLNSRYDRVDEDGAAYGIDDEDVNKEEELN